MMMMMMMLMLEIALISVCALMGLLSPAARAAGPLPLHTADPVTGGERARLEAPYLHLPVFRHFRKPRFNKQHFSPAHVKSREPLPERVRQILVPAPRRHPKTRMNASGPVRVACSARRMRVRVHTASLGSSAKRVHVSLGTCEARKATERIVFFSNDLHECGTRRRVMNKTVVYSNMLYYTSDVTGSGNETLTVPVQCRFNTFHYSYKMGFMPSVEALKIYKPMKTRGSVTLTACDAQWNRLPPGEGFVIGQPMYFKAETLYVPDDKRLFVHFCHVTVNSSHVSTPQVKIIDNYGCLIDSERRSQSRFINGTRRNIVRFTVDAFTLQGKVQKMVENVATALAPTLLMLLKLETPSTDVYMEHVPYVSVSCYYGNADVLERAMYLFMHCEMSIGSVVPTATSKSCTYNHLEHRWEELYGADSVCSCCDSSCVPVMPILMRPMVRELGASVEPDQEETGRKNPTQSTEGIFTPEPDHGVLMSESRLKIIPESRPASAHKHGAVTVETTPAPGGKREALTPEIEHVEIMLERLPPSGSEQVVPMPGSGHLEITDVSTPTLVDGPGILTPGYELGPMMPEHKDGTLMLDRKHEEATPETPPTPDSVSGTPVPHTNHEKITPYPQETVTPQTSVQPNTRTPVHTHTPLREPYRIFEEVFGLS